MFENTEVPNKFPRISPGVSPRDLCPTSTAPRRAAAAATSVVLLSKHSALSLDENARRTRNIISLQKGFEIQLTRRSRKIAAEPAIYLFYRGETVRRQLYRTFAISFYCAPGVKVLRSTTFRRESPIFLPVCLTPSPFVRLSVHLSSERVRWQR